MTVLVVFGGVSCQSAPMPSPSASASGPVESALALVETARSSAAPSSAPPSPQASAVAPRLRGQASKVQGFQVYERDGVVVAFKSYYVDNVYDRKTVDYPSCDALPATTTIVLRGAATLDDRRSADWQLFEQSARFGVYARRSYAPQGDYGTQVECCASGDELDATAHRATMTRVDALRALEVCRDLFGGPR